MSDFEDMVRRTFAAHEPDAPSADGLSESVQARTSNERSKAPWLVPLAASALTAALVVGVVTDGFGMGSTGPASQPAPAVSATPTPTTSPDPDQSALAAKCDEPPVMNTPASPQLTFSEGVKQEVTIAVGQRIFLGAVTDSCGGIVTFNGRPQTPFLTGELNVAKGTGYLKAVRPGIVRITPFDPMCPPDTSGCFGGVDDLGTIEVTIEPREPPTPVIGKCSANEFSLRAEAGPGTASEMLWVTVRLADTRGCLLSGTANVEVFDRDGVPVSMPGNPLTRQIRESLRPGHPVVITWGWLDWFCGRADPYSARLGVLGQTDRVDEMNTPSCPTEYGDPPRDPRGLRFHSVMVLR